MSQTNWGKLYGYMSAAGGSSGAWKILGPLIQRQRATSSTAPEVAPSYILDYNDPMAINSLADVILNQAALDKSFQGGVFDTPVLGQAAKRIAAQIKLIQDSTIKPILEGGHFGAAAINTLQNAMESLDVLANPIKGLVLEGKEGFVKGIGLGSEGRVNYDYDFQTGSTPLNLVLNMAAEIVSDPLNWITLGGAALAKSAGTKAGKEALESSARAVTRTVLTEGQESVTRTFGKELAERAAKLSVDDAIDLLRPHLVSDDMVEAVAKRAASLYTSGKIADFNVALLQAGRHYQYTAQLKNYTGLGRGVFGVPTEVLTSLPNNLNQTTMKALSGLQKMVQTVDRVEAGVLRASLISAGPGIPWEVGRFLVSESWTTRHLGRQLVDAAKVYELPTGIPLTSLPALERDILNYLETIPDLIKEFPDISSELKGAFYVKAIQNEQSAISNILQQGVSATQKLRMLEAYSQQHNKMAFADYITYLVTQAAAPDTTFLSSHASFLENAKMLLMQSDGNASKKVAQEISTSFISRLEDFQRLADFFPRLEQAAKGISFTDEEATYRSLSYAYQHLAEYLTQTKNTHLPPNIRHVPALEQNLDKVVVLAKQAAQQRTLEAYVAVDDALAEFYTNLVDARDAMLKGSKPATMHKSMSTLLNQDSTRTFDKLLELRRSTDNAPLLRPLRNVRDTNAVLNIDPQLYPSVIAKDVTALFSEQALEALETSLPDTLFASLRTALNAVDDAQLGGIEYDLAASLQDLQDTLKYLSLEDPVARTPSILKAHGFDALAAGSLPDTLQSRDAVLALFQDAIDLIDQVPAEILAQVEEVTLDALGDSVGYTFQRLKAVAAVQLMEVSRLEEFTKGMLFGSPLANDLNMLKAYDAFAPAVTALESFAHHYEHTRGLYDNILQSVRLTQGPNDVRAAFFDTLQSYDRLPIPTMQNNLSFFTDQIIDKVETQINVTHQKNRRDLSTLLDEIRGKFPDTSDEFKELTRLINDAHDAAADVRSVEYVLEHLLNHKFAPNEFPVLIDIEASGLDVRVDQIYQIHYKMPKTGVEKTLYIRPPEGMYPPASFLRKLYQIPDGPTLSMRELQKLFDDSFLNKELISERDALATLLEDLSTIPSGELPVLVGHNIQGYDKDFLFGRLRNTKDYGLINAGQASLLQAESFDTLLELQRKQGYMFLSDAQKEEITRLLSMYTETLVSSPFVVRTGRFLPNLGRDFTNSVEDIITAIKEDPTPLAKTWVGGSNAIINELNDLVRDLAVEMGDIRTSNALTGGYFTLLEDLPTSSLNILNSTQLVSDSVDLLAPYAVRRSIDMPILKDLYHMDALFPNTRIGTEEAKQLTKSARWMMGRRERVLNMELLQQHSNDIREAAELLQNRLLALPMNTRKKAYWMHINLDHNDIRTLYAQASYLYSEAKTISFLPEIPEKLSGAFTLLKEDTLFSRERAQSFGKFFEISLHEDSLNLHQERLVQERLIQSVADQTTELQKYKLRHDKTFNSFIIAENILPKIEHAATVMQRYGVEDTSSAHRALAENARTALLQYGDARNAQIVDQILRMPTEDLRSFLWHEAQGQVAIALPTFLSDADFHQTFQTFMRRIPDLEQAGFGVKQSGTRLYIYVSNSNVDMFKDIPRKAFRIVTKDIDIPDMPADLAAVLKDLRETVQLLSDHSDGLSVGSMVYPDRIKKLRESFPDEVLKELVPVDDLQAAGLFQGSRFNHSFYGPMTAGRATEAWTSSNPIKVYTKTLEHYLRNADAQTKIRLALSGEKSVVSMKNVFGAASTEEILDMVKTTPGIRLAYFENIPKNAKQYYKRQYRLAEISLRSAEDVRVAMDAGAIVLSDGAYSFLQNIINQTQLVDKSFIDTMSSVIVDPYKAGYLSSPGLLLRNLVDSTLKNLTTVDSLADVPKMFWHTIETFKLWRQYTLDIQALCRAGNDGFFNKAVFNEFFAKPENAPRKDAFKLIHTLVNEGPMDMAQAQAKLVAQKAKTLRALKDDGFFITDAMRKVAWGNPYTHAMMNLNTQIEQVMRLSKYTWELGAGASMDDAIAAVIRAHFDYRTKSIGKVYLELVIPFATFTIENIKFWTEMLTKHGWVASMLRDTFAPIINMDDYTNYELNVNRSIQYAMLNGSLQLDDSGLAIKLSPSFMDAFNTLSDPVGSIESRILAPLRVPLRGIQATMNGEDYDWGKEIATNLPLIGPTLQRYWTEDSTAQKTYRRTGSPLAFMPSVFGSIARPLYFAYPNSAQVYSTTDSEVFLKHINNGAYAVQSSKQVKEESSQPIPKKRPYTSTFYPRKYYARRGGSRRAYARRTYARKSYPRKRAYFRGTYVPAERSAKVMSKVLASVRNTQIRMPSAYRNYVYTAPSVYRQVQSGKPVRRLQTSFVPTNQYVVRYQMRTNQSYRR